MASTTAVKRTLPARRARRFGSTGSLESADSSTPTNNKRPASSSKPNSRATSPALLPEQQQQQQSLSHKRRRFLDATLLGRGMSSRHVGAHVNLHILGPEEIDRDLRHMEAYSNACIAYSQQFFIYHNRALVQSGHYGSTVGTTTTATPQYLQQHPSTPTSSATKVMPIRIDPEEEKRIALLRKRIATSEAQRQVMETEYMSLRATYVHESQRLAQARQSHDGQLVLLQQLIQRRGRVVALRRVICQVARDVAQALERRTHDASVYKLWEQQNGGTAATTVMSTRHADILQVWNDLEAQLKEAERACMTCDLPKELTKSSAAASGSKKSSKKRKMSDDNHREALVAPWQARSLPQTPYNVPVLLSQLSQVPDYGAAYAASGAFGGKPASLCWLQDNLPPTFQDLEDEKEEVAKIRAEADSLQSELEKERSANKDLQQKIIHTRKRNDEMCCMMTLLRSETEAVLLRHNVLLDTPRAIKAAKALHAKLLKEREAAAQEGDLVEEEGGKKKQGEGGDEDSDECGGAPPSEVILDKEQMEGA